jgi:transglutaminase-like putative cysteine protease
VYDLTLNAFNRPIDEKSFGDYDLSTPQVAFYTKSEPFLEQTAEIFKAAREAIGGEINPWARARLIFRWVRKHMVYQYPPPGGRGATVALREGRGDCGQYADLFIAMCRSAGIPARFVGGFALHETQPGQPPVVGSHAWAEVLLPDGSWAPVDPTGDEEGHFGRCNVNTHITSSVGRNILLPGAPVWATYKFSDVQDGRTEFMQTFSEMKTGVRASVKIERKAYQR